jgi:hypothetical protein
MFGRPIKLNVNIRSVIVVFKCLQVYVFTIWSFDDRFENETTSFETAVSGKITFGLMTIKGM